MGDGCTCIENGKLRLWLDDSGQLFGGCLAVLIAMATRIEGQVTPPVKWILPARLGVSKSKRRVIHSHADGATDTARSPSRSYCVAILAIVPSVAKHHDV